MGVIQDGYYYPRPEEIFIGYQCEVCWTRGYDETYSPEVVRLKEENGTYVRDFENLTIAMDDGYAECRVPLLSKADIESLGWENRHDLWWQIGEWTLNVYKDGSIKMEGPKGYIYNGPCPTINHLKFLMDLLKIDNGNREGS
jgi:hypothetical protein